MKDNSMKHISDFDSELTLEIFQEEPNKFTIQIYNTMQIFPAQDISFTTEGIIDLIQDLQNVIK